MKKVALIMAGGKGERFWPKSTEIKPKQFFNLIDPRYTMLQLTVNRLISKFSFEDIYIVTREVYVPLICEQCPEIPLKNIIVEPMRKNTAACITLATSIIKSKIGDCLICVLPSDHLIKDTDNFHNSLDVAFKTAVSNNLVTIGIPAKYPETAYGYIKAQSNKNGIYDVEEFVEKPGLILANEYIESNHYFWNSGIFIWKASTILNKIEKTIPQHSELIKLVHKLRNVESEEIIDAYNKLKPLSIDKGLLEKETQIKMILASFDWDDVGTWTALERQKVPDQEGNIIDGNVVSLDTENCMIFGNRKLISCIGLKDMIIVDTDDTLFISSKDEVYKLKDLLNKVDQNHK